MPKLARLMGELAEAAQSGVSQLPEPSPRDKRRIGGVPAKRRLAEDCLELFERYRPGEASTTAEGPYRTLVGYLFEVATGKRDADLEKPARQALARMKHRSSGT